MRQAASDTDSLLSEPPPSYHSYERAQPRLVRHLKARDQSEEDDREGRNFWRTILIVLLTLLAVLFVTGFVLQVISFSSSRNSGIYDPIVRERIRKEWQKETDAHAEEVRQRKEMHSRWEKEDAKRAHMRQQWEADRSQHADEVRRWNEERARQLGKLWNEPVASRNCFAYGTRMYTAELDELAVCKNAPLMIHGKNVTAAECTTHQGLMHNKITGQFVVNFDEAACHPHWGRMYDKGCVVWGPRGTHRVESRLWGINHGDNWGWMCDTTPAVINGIDFAHPTRCENRGIFFGMVGIFEYSDPGCGWNALAVDESLIDDGESTGM